MRVHRARRRRSAHARDRRLHGKREYGAHAFKTSSQGSYLCFQSQAGSLQSHEYALGRASGSQRPVGVRGGNVKDRRKGTAAERSSPSGGRARPGGRNQAHFGRHELHAAAYGGGKRSGAPDAAEEEINSESSPSR